MATIPSEKYAIAFGRSFAVTSVLSALLVVVKERNETVMAWMKAAMGHHWVTHGVLTIVLFVVLGAVLAARSSSTVTSEDYNRTAIAVSLSTIISGLIIAGFFLLH